MGFVLPISMGGGEKIISMDNHVNASKDLDFGKKSYKNVLFVLVAKGIIQSDCTEKQKTATLRWVKRNFPTLALLRVKNGTLICDSEKFEKLYETFLVSRIELKEKQKKQLFLNVAKHKAEMQPQQEEILPMEEKVPMGEKVTTEAKVPMETKAKGPSEATPGLPITKRGRPAKVTTKIFTAVSKNP